MFIQGKLSQFPGIDRWMIKALSRSEPAVCPRDDVRRDRRGECDQGHVRQHGPTGGRALLPRPLVVGETNLF